MSGLWQSIVETFTGGSSKSPSLSELRKQREMAADAADAEALTRGEYGQAMTPWGQLPVYDPTDPRFRQQVEDVWAAHRKTFKGESGRRKGLMRWEVSARMARAWAEQGPKPPVVKRDRQKALQQQEKIKYDRGLRPGRTPQQQNLIQSGVPIDVSFPEKYGTPKT